MRFHPAGSSRGIGDSNRIISGSVIEYEQHGKPYLGFILEERKSNFAVINERGQELTLSPDRIFLLPLSVDASDKQGALREIEKLLKKSAEKRGEIDLASLWELLSSEKRELSERTICELLFPNEDASELLAVRRALVEDVIYFKRRKTGYEPRPAEIVEELKKKAEADAEKAKERASFKRELLDRIKGEKRPFERNWGKFGISDLEDLAALGGQSSSARETTDLLEEILESEKLSITGKPQDRAFQLLILTGHFKPDADLNLISIGRPVHFPPHVADELSSLLTNLEKAPQRQLSKEVFTVTIDSESTRDIDDALSLEELPDGYRIGIHISDVANVVSLGSRLDEQALRRATSLYTPDYQIPMFPLELSERALSLVEGECRPVTSFYLETDKQFELRGRSVCSEVIKIGKRLSYTEVDEILEEDRNFSPLNPLLIKLWEASSAFESKRILDGALQFPRRELIPRIDEKGIVTLEHLEEETPARKLVSELMIAANVVAANYAKKHGIPLVFRGQEAPDSDILASGQDILEGPAREYYLRGLMKRSVTSVEPLPHSGLGVDAYTQVTSPIRRAVDLLNQRQLNSHLSTGKALFDREHFRKVIEECEARLDEAFYIQRQRNRYWLLRYLEQRKQSHIEGVIVRVDAQRPLVELSELQTIVPFQPAKAVGDFADRAASRLGEKVRLKISKLNARDDRLFLVEEP